MSDDLNSDAPYLFFFNSEQLSRWAGQWHLCSLGEFLNDFIDDPESGWDEFVGYQHIWHLQCRINHEGSIDSEDPTIFHVCAQEVLRVMLLNQDRIIESIKSNIEEDISAQDVFIQIVTGVAEMIKLCDEYGCAFWASGHESDRQRVVDWMRWCELPSDHTDFQVAPHIQQRRSEQASRASFQLSDLRSLAQNGLLDKRLRTVINQLPKLIEQGGTSNHPPTK